LSVAAGLVVAGGVATLALLSILLSTALARRRAPRLPAAAAFEEPVTALLPVRNEAANVGECLDSLLRQQGPLSIRVADDGSRDGTSALVAAIAAREPRVTLLTVPSPASGWSGKTNALSHAARGVADDWLLAVDADVRLGPAAVASALAAARVHGLDALSLAARQRVETLGEALLTPLVFGMLDWRLGDWRVAARGDGAPVANGQFFLLRRAALEAAGGYAAIAGQTLDDVALARALGAAGRRCGFWRAGSALSTRMYDGFAASFRGWRRNLALIDGASALPVAAILGLALAPTVTAVAAGLAGETRWLLAAWCAGIAASSLARAGTGSPSAFGLLYPFDAVAFSFCLLAARIDRRFGRAVRWRGRTVGQPETGNGPE